MNSHLPRRRAGFLLLETMIGVAIFALGLLGLARCVGNCMDAETAKNWDERARVALENRMAEIEAGAVGIKTDKQETLSGMFKGITLRQTRAPLALKCDPGKEAAGLYKVQLEAAWNESACPQSKSVMFYVFQRQ